MNKLILALLMLLVSSTAWGSTWYIRTDGSNNTNCTGHTNAAYPGSGTGQACAFNDLAWVLPPSGGDTSTAMQGGDTVIVDAAGQYMVGYGMANTISAQCHYSYPYNCVLGQVPSGTAGAHSRILGSNYASCSSKSQLWGTQSIYQILDISGKNYVDVQCLEITDHSSCGFRSAVNACSESYISPGSAGTYARTGIYGKQGSNITLKDLDIHGLGYYGMNVGGINNLTVDTVNVDGNAGQDWNGDVGETGGVSYFSGTISIPKSKFRFSGCEEAYPRSGSFNTADYDSCYNQGSADGAGFYATGGTWDITNSEFSHNSSDGLDLLYCDDTCNIFIDKSLFEGNWGNQLKFLGKNVSVTNSALIANCTYLAATGKNNGNTGGITTACRANGTPISAVNTQGSAWTFKNDTFYSSNSTAGGSAVIEAYNADSTCNGTETYAYSNNIQYSATGGGSNWITYYGTFSGACATAWNAATTNHTNTYNFQNCPSGTGNVCSNPNWSGSISATADSNIPNVYLTPSSPGKGGGTTNTYWNNSNDYNCFPQNSPIDQGALQYNSVPSCSGGCTTNGGGCSVGTTCCSNYCIGNTTCGDCITKGNSCSLDSDCCTGMSCHSGTCLLNNGQTCLVNGDCVSNICCSHTCAASCGGGPSGAHSITSGNVQITGNYNS